MHSMQVCWLGMMGAFAVAAVNFAFAQELWAQSSPAPEVLSAEKERALKPKSIFRECDVCPEMIVVPAGEFMMGSPANEKDRSPYYEDPRRKVRIPAAFAVSRFEITFDEWNACVSAGVCEKKWSKASGRQPANFISWQDAQKYMAWISKQTGKRYRLLTEAEWEYAARAGSDKAYSWGDDIGKGNANCLGCGSRWEGNANSSGETAPVGSFPANAFGLHDMHGNVYEWVEDCFHWNYKGAPADGSAWTVSCYSEGGDLYVIRGGDYSSTPKYIRSAFRDRMKPTAENGVVGLRAARTLAP